LSTYSTNIIKQIPALRFLLPISLGIILEYHLKISIASIFCLFVISISILLLFSFFTTSKKFAYSFVKGVGINLLFLTLGLGLSYSKFISNSENWFGNYFTKSEPTLVTLEENLSVKEKSFKALASINAIYVNNHWRNVNGKMLLYFKRDSLIPNLKYGSQIIINGNINPIINSGNPGGFNYAEYCSFQDIHHQAFLTTENYNILSTAQTNWLSALLIKTRIKIIATLSKNVKNPDALSVAEALLIGYRNDLDRDLVRAYSNTGVVHIIAISGLHLGMIYGLLLLFFKPLKRFKVNKILQPVTIILVLWIFSFIAGLAPSILRSAIMFTCIVIGESTGKRSNIYNSLAVSALIILLINPFSLWDVGFQLSYTAVLSIVIFSPYIKKWFYFKNKILTGIWALNSITLSAQILTLPIVLYHFHQFPNLFLFTNAFAVPFTGIILYLEIFLVAFSWLTPLSAFIGALVNRCITLLNSFILNVDTLPFAVWESIQITIPQSIVLYFIIIGFSYWLIEKKIKFLLLGLTFLASFIAIRSIDFIRKNHQQKIIVYNVPKHTAIDLIDGRNYFFLGDSILNENGFLRNFHIKPSRVLHRVNACDTLQNFIYTNNYIITSSKIIAVVSSPITQKPNLPKADVIVITKNPKVHIPLLSQAFRCNNFIFDGSNSMWKINKWKQQCDSLHLHYYISSLQGAYEINL